MKSIVNGTLLAYWEQGWEGRIEFAFQPENKNDFITLRNDQHLTIFDGNERIIWTGLIQFTRRSLFDNHKLKAGIWSEIKQKDVPYADWMDWFWRKPPLKAKLELEEKYDTTRSPEYK